MDTVTVPASVQVGHQWMTAHWSVEEVGDGGEIVIGVTLTANRVPYLRLRMDTALVRDLRVLAGFDGEIASPQTARNDGGEYDCRTNAERIEALERRVAALEAVLRGLAKAAGSRSMRSETIRSAYNPEKDSGAVTWVDATLLRMLESMAIAINKTIREGLDDTTSDA